MKSSVSIVWPELFSTQRWRLLRSVKHVLAGDLVGSEADRTARNVVSSWPDQILPIAALGCRIIASDGSCSSTRHSRASEGAKSSSLQLVSPVRLRSFGETNDESACLAQLLQTFLWPLD